MQSILYGGLILLVEVPRGPLERSFLSSADASRPLAELPLTHLKILFLLFSMEISIIIVEKFDDASRGVCLLQPLLTVLLFRIALGPISSCRLLMPSIDIYVQVTVTPHDLSGRPSDSPQTAIVEVPGARIERYREQSPYAGEATDEQLAEYLAAEIGPHALARTGLYRPVRWLVESVALPQRPPGVEARPSDCSYDGMKAWIPTRQSFV
jgi:hypothetical protein